MAGDPSHDLVIDLLDSCNMTEASIAALPPDVFQILFSHLSAAELARAQCVCKSWLHLGTHPLQWEKLYRSRWRQGDVQRWEPLQQSGNWYELYNQRAKLDGMASAHLDQLQWPGRWFEAIQDLHRLGFSNFKDMLLERLADQQAGCGRKYWARVAAEDLVGRQAADQMAALVGAHEGRHLDEGAMLVAALHHPLADLGWVRSALDSLGLELTRRLAAAGIAAGGVPALHILSALLFGTMPPPSHPGFAAIPPPAGFGMGLQGNRESYYDPANSLLSDVLVNREGIPISLAVIHSAVAARAGLDVQLLNVPMHVVTHFGDEGSDEERFIDVFDQGKILTRDEMGALLWELGLPGFDRRHLQPLAPARVYARMLYNLASIYSALGSGGDVEALKMQKNVMRLLAAVDRSDTFTSRLELAKACAALLQYEEALEILRSMLEEGAAPPGSPSSARTLLQEHVRRLSAAVQERQREEGRMKQRHGSSTGVRYEVGQIIRHRRYEYRGVIVGWDHTCCASEDWMRQMGVDRLERGRHQPFYQVLVDPQDRGGQQTYVAEENISLEALLPRQRSPGFEVHPDVGRYFERLQPDGAGYVLNQWMRERYPND